MAWSLKDTFALRYSPRQRCAIRSLSAQGRCLMAKESHPRNCNLGWKATSQSKKRSAGSRCIISTQFSFTRARASLLICRGIIILNPVTFIDLQCWHCGERVWKVFAQWKRSGPACYCNRTCAGYSRRKGKTRKQLKAEKKAYDVNYRAKNLATIKAKKKAHFQRTYDPVKAAIERKKTMPRHVAYCRRPEYRKKKQSYDEAHRAKKYYGPFAESVILLKNLDAEVTKRASDYEIRLATGTLNKKQNRQRQHEKTNRH